MSTIVAASYLGTPGLGSGVFVTIYDHQSGSVIVSRTNSGISERQAGTPAGPSGYYSWTGTVADALAYDALWDEGAPASGAGELWIPLVQQVVQPVAAVAQILGPSPAPGVLWRKRNDTREPVLYQAVEWNENTQLYQPVDITGASIRFLARQQPDLGALKINGAGRIASIAGAAANGWMFYQFATGDLDTAGDFDWEFQVTFPDGRVQTFPVTTDPSHEYGILHVIPDLGP